MLVRVDTAILRPLLVSRAETVEVPDRTTPTADNLPLRREFRLCGTIFAEPDDHTCAAFRGWAAGGADPARITGRPDRHLSLGYGEWLASGPGIGQWQPRGGR